MIDSIEKELLDRNTTAERVQEIFNSFIEGSREVIKKVTLENGFYAVTFKYLESNFHVRLPVEWLVPRKNPIFECWPFKKRTPEYTIHFPKDKLTNDQIVKLLNSVES